MESRGKKRKRKEEGWRREEDPSLPTPTPSSRHFSLVFLCAVLTVCTPATGFLLMNWYYVSRSNCFLSVSPSNCLVSKYHNGSPESPLISTHVTVITLSAATELNRQSRNLPGCEFFKKRLFTSYWICCEPQKSFYPTLLLRLLQNKYHKLHFCCYLYSWIMTCETSYRSLFWVTPMLCLFICS